MSLIGTALTFGKLLHDLILWESEPKGEYTRTAITITNGTGSDVEYELGTIIADATLADSATDIGLQPAFDDAILLTNFTVPAGESKDVPALVRGPALVNFDELIRTSEGESDASLIARCDKMILQGVRFVREPLVQEETELNG